MKAPFIRNCRNKTEYDYCVKNLLSYFEMKEIIVLNEVFLTENEFTELLLDFMVRRDYLANQKDKLIENDYAQAFCTKIACVEVNFGFSVYVYTNGHNFAKYIYIDTELYSES